MVIVPSISSVCIKQFFLRNVLPHGFGSFLANNSYRFLAFLTSTLSQSEMRAELRDWDLWGPFFLCMSLAVMLSIKAHDEASVVFSVIFVIVWVGAAVITINGQLLGGRLYVYFQYLVYLCSSSNTLSYRILFFFHGNRSFFQSVCLLGYCIFPVLLSAIACWTINSFVRSDVAVVLRFVSVLVALLWSIWGRFFFPLPAHQYLILALTSSLCV